MAEQIFDSWVADLRGTGLSLVPSGQWTDIHFDHSLELDLPAVVESICRATGNEELL